MDGNEPQNLLALPTTDLRARLANGAVRAVDVAAAHLARIEAEEERVGAWAWIDPEFVMRQARAMDAYRATGRPIGALHGLPVGLKDVIDTARIPTENGTPIDSGRVPTSDAWLVSRLKQAGAIIMGKTVSAELAFLHPGKTRNPHDLAHTPGGSSSGSAAAVAAGMVPLAVGTQTGGSVIRPAAFCGVTGFKATFGAIPRTGVLRQSPSLDTIGVFARTPLDAAMLAEALFGQDDGDPATRAAPVSPLFQTASQAPPLRPVFAFVKPPGWDASDPEMQQAMSELIAALGPDNCFEISLPDAFEDAAALRECINYAEMAQNFRAYLKRGKDQLSPEILDAIAKGEGILATDYIAAREWADVLYAMLEPVFETCDAILTPAAPGPAPKRLDSTGSSIFNGLWTLIGTPAVTVPAMTASNGLPLGVQLVSARGNDARLLRTAQWLYDWVETASD